MPKLVVRGQLDPKAEAPSLAGHIAKGRLTPKYSGRPSATRAGAPRHELERADADDMVELELADGFKLWTRVDDLQNDYKPVADRGDDPAEEGEIPAALQVAGPTRGPVGKFAIQAFRIFGVDAPGAIAGLVGDRVEGQLKPGPGLYQCTAAGPAEMDAPKKLGQDGAALVFLHGTASSTLGSFGALWDPAAGGRMNQLLGAYKGRVLAFQHRTLTRSPIDNALELAEALGKVLPKGAPVHLVSHSRGGLVGELMCRSMMDGRAPFIDAEIERFQELGREDDAKQLAELNDALTRTAFQVERFVRVACPARGTTLASGRLDRYLSVALNVIGRIPGLEGNALYDTFSELIAAVIKKKADPNDLPGLEAMMPTSPLVALLNNPAFRTAADLHVLGGDLKSGGGAWGRLKALATDLFYLEDHDLVVNTPSMFGGGARTDKVHYWIDTGTEVNHFNYFRNADTAARLVEGLTAQEPGRFREQDKAPSEITADDYQKRALGSLMPRQTVVVLPGIMGTQLKIGKNRIWVDFFDLAKGGLSKLKLGGRATVETDGLVADSYKKLVSFLANSHDVEMFPYDWRLSIEQSAKELRKKLEEILKRTGTEHPVRIVAHSMGGLVVRAMLATPEGQESWAKMKRHPGSRFIMLGTPNGGSHAISALLLGRDSLVRKLALVDLTKSHAKLLGVIAGFDGVLQLLPHKGTLDCYERSAWDALYENDAPPGKRGIFSSEVATEKSAEIDWARPDPEQLKEGRKIRDLIQMSPVDAERMIYVAGKAPATASDVRIEANNPPGRKVVVLATARGDGRVPWATGIPAGLEANTYYMDATHGDLANHEDSFTALLDLLERGVTSKLPKTAPAARAVTEETFELKEEHVEAYPSRGDLIATALGGSPPSLADKAETPKVKVRVVHGNLARATSPVAVGHYDGDTIVSAEGYLDYQLGGRLIELHRLGLYPGPLETAAVELNDRKSANHPGAIVVGLGDVGDLTPGGLARTVSHGLRSYGAARLAEIRKARSSSAAGDENGELKLSVLLIGTGAGGLTVADSLQSILRGVALANAKLQDAAGSDEDAPDVRVAEVDVVELYEDRALQAVKSLIDLNRTGEFRNAFELQETLVDGERGRTRAFYAESEAWWQRIRIQTETKGPYKDALKFEAVTNRARADTFLQPTQQKIVERFLERARTAAWSDPGLSYTLFELLIPNDFKQYAPDRRNLALVLDEGSARYPWELLQDRFDRSAGPLAVESGMVRMLVTPERRERPLPAKDLNALVIGDPAGVTPRLPGAAAEAQQVRRQLVEGRRDRQFDVKALIEGEATPEKSLLALYEKPYRVVHIAAHGLYDPPKDDGCGGRLPARSGVVLEGAGDPETQILLTPAEFEQMRYVPDLVFLNCCHLAQMAGGTLQPPDVDHRFAANVATQFIRMGVRAVVAAGWAVDDGPAKVFAAAFYREMLAGRTFGDSVRIARQAVYQQSPQSNTWGAYQCYGDPGFRLFEGSGDGRGGDPPSSAAELRVALQAIASDAGSATPQDVEPLRSHAEALVRAADPAWVGRTDVLGELGEVYGELGFYAEAIDSIEKAMPAEPAYQKVRSLERLVNFRARWAETIFSAGGENPPADPRELIDKAEKLSELLLELGETMERRSIRGSLYKRKAVIEHTNQRERERDLVRMAEEYRRGYEIAKEKDFRDFHFPLQNWCASQIALQWVSSKKLAEAAQIQAARKELQDRADSLTAEQSKLWDLVSKADLKLLDALFEKRLAEEKDAIVGLYSEAVMRGASMRERRSMTENLRFFEAMTVKSKAPKAAGAILKDIRAQMEGAK
jgi:pimeloyl-ACP methyl ester carboxylesterase